MSTCRIIIGPMPGISKPASSASLICRAVAIVVMHLDHQLMFPGVGQPDIFYMKYRAINAGFLHAMQLSSYCRLAYILAVLLLGMSRISWFQTKLSSGLKLWPLPHIQYDGTGCVTQIVLAVCLTGALHRVESCCRFGPESPYFKFESGSQCLPCMPIYPVYACALQCCQGFKAQKFCK